MFVLGTLVIIVLAYYVTYLVAKGGTKSAQSKTIKVIDRRSLSKDKLICLIEVAEKVYLVAMTDGGVSLLDTLDDEAAEVVREQSRMMPAFSGVVQKGITKGFSAIFDKKKREADHPDPEDFVPEPPEEPPVAEDFDVPEQISADTDPPEDDLDEMYRKLKGRREKKRPPEGGHDQ